MEYFDAIANMSALSFAQHMVNGISLGSLYALIAIGYTMVYGILLMINFAHGDIVMMACYFAFFGITAFHIPWYFTFIITIILTAIDSDTGRTDRAQCLPPASRSSEKFHFDFRNRRIVLAGKLS